MDVMRIPLSQIRPDPQSPGVPAPQVADLAESIREYGLLRPILVRRTDDGYVIVHGERRWHAMRMLGRATIVAYLVLDVLQRSGGAL